MSASPPSWTGSDEDLERCFLLDVDGLGEEEEGLAPAEVAPDAPDDTCQWEEFMSSANTVNDKLVVFQAAIASAVASASLLELNSVTAKGVPASASALALGADTEPKIPLEEDCSADSDTDAVTRHSAVSSVLEDMLRSLEQLWETMAAACVCPPAPVEHTVESAEGRSHLIIIDDADDPPLSTTAHMVQIDANETVADRVKLIHEMNRLALESTLKAEHENYLIEQEGFQRRREEQRAQLERRQGRRAEEALRQKSNRLALNLQRISRGYLARKIFQYMLATEKQRKLDLQRFEVECASRAMLTEDVRSRAAWAYAKEIEAYNKEIVRLRLEEEERKMCLKREEDLKLALELEAEALRLAELDARVAAELKQKNITEENEKREKQLAKDMLEANKSASAYSMVQIGTAKKKGSTSWGGLISRPDASVSAAKSIREQPMICSQTAPSINDENNQLPSLNEIHQLQMEVLPSSVLDLIDEITSNALQKLEKKLRNRESAVCASFNLLRNSSNEHGVLTAKWESILSKAHLAWKLWLKEQPIEIFEAYTDAASQYHYADIGENLSRCGGVADLKTYAEYTVEDIDKLDFLENRIDLRNLILNVNNITSLQEISKLVELDSLSIKDNRLKNLDGLVNMKKLRSLVFDVNQVDDLSALRELPSLVVLSASTNCISEVPHLSSPHLQRLNLYHNKLSTIMSLTPIRSRVLTHLDLGRNKLHFVSGEALSQCQLLTQLILSQNCLEAVPFPLRLPNLKSLWISGNRLSGLTEWSPVYSEETPIKYPCFLPMLDKLYLQDNSIRTLKQQSLAAMPLLTHIDLSFNNIGVTMDDSSVEIDLSALRDCFLLRSVQLQDNPINVHSAAAVMSLLPNCPQLQEFSGVDIEHLKKKIGSSYHCQRDVHCILHQILENGSTDAIISSTLAATPAVHCHLFAGAASELKTRPNASFGLFGAPLSTNIGYNTYDRVLVEVITTLNSAAFSDKCVVKHENRLVRMKTSQLSNTSQEFNFDSLAQNGVDSSISLLLPLINIRLLFEWAPENSHMALYKTIACRGETGCEIKSKVPARVQQNIANSVTLIQKRYRGYRLRKQIQHALRMIYYNDDDLDDAMFSDDLLKDMEIPELDDNYWKVTLPINVIAPEPSQYSHSLTGSVVYGDHIRARGNSGRNRPSSDSSDIKVSICADELISGSSLEENRLKHGIRAGWAEAVSISGEISNGYFIEERECESSGRFAQQSISRPSTNMSNISVASSQAHSVDDFDYSEKSTPREYKDDKNKLANEWGFTNSSVIEAMKKRNKRMKGFATAKDKREKNKHSDERLKMFVRQAAKNPQEGSGSFGGKPKQFKSMKPRQQAAVHPAWLGGAIRTDDNIGDAL